MEMTKKRRRGNLSVATMAIIMGLVGTLVLTNVFFVSIYGIHLRSETDINEYGAIRTIDKVLYSRRGYIFDRNGNILAQDNVSYDVYAVLNPNTPDRYGERAYVSEENKEEYANILSTILGRPTETLLELLTVDWLEYSQIRIGTATLTEKEDIEALELYGLTFEEKRVRNYPYGNFASHLLGYADFSDEEDMILGRLGIEEVYNDFLLGRHGKSSYSVDGKDYKVLGSEYLNVPAVNGKDIYLTIDRQTQEALELVISEMVKQQNASQMWGGVMEVETGKILGWSDYPSFNPNLDERDITLFQNLGLERQYEPGSTMKTFTYAAAIDSGRYNGENLCDVAPFYIGRNGDELFQSTKPTSEGTIRNYQTSVRGKVTYDQAYYMSYNTGIATVIDQVIDQHILEDYFDAFGFYQPVGVNDLPESGGVKNMDAFIDVIASGYGQASSVTAIQMMQAYTAIFNHGKMMKPYFVDYIYDGNTNETIYQAKPEVVGEPIKASTADTMVDMMEQVVINDRWGTGYGYAINELGIVAKTGTAELAVDGAYGKEYIYSVMIGMPADNPKIMIYLAYQAPDQKGAHQRVEPIRHFLSKLVKNLGLISNNTTVEDEDNPFVIDPTTQFENFMPVVVNHSMNYSASILEKYKLKPIYIGVGNSIIEQYPQSGVTVVQGQKVFLLISTDRIQMPNMIGWTKKEIQVFESLTGIRINIVGNGFAKSQTVVEGTNIDSTMEIIIELGMRESTD